jgi:ATP-dependent Lon protease
MEIIEFPGYTEEDKLDIAREFLIPKQLEAHGLSDSGVRFTTEALQTIVRDYTYEAGVRNFEREIANVCRKISRLIAEEKRYPRRLTSETVIKYLGPPEHLPMRANQEDSIGVATGMAWTAGGGDILTIEVTVLPGKGTMMLTGQLGDVMQESAQAAMSYLRSRADDFDIQAEEFENCDVHIHLPEGAVPKEGPSAGITLAAALISAFTERKVRSDIAMTGEITLHGKILPVGGVKEKVLAARRAKITQIILPDMNRRDLVDIPPRALRGLNLIFVDNMQQVIDSVLVELDPDRVRRSRVPTGTDTEDDSDG